MPRPRKDAADVRPHPIPDFMAASAVLPNQPKAPQVYELMRRAIVNLAFPPDTALSEKLICERLGISRTPLREAMLQLQAESLVHVIPNNGTFVSPIDLQRLFDGQLVRDAIETRVVQFAAVKADAGFDRRLAGILEAQRAVAEEQDYDRFYELDEALHQAICEFGASSRLWRMVNGAKAQLDRVRRLAMPELGHLEVVLAEHAGIVDALAQRDPAAARRAMQAHLGRVFLTIRLLLEGRPEHFAPGSRAVFERLAELYRQDPSP